MAYLLDANVLITAKNTYYGFDFCPAFWDWIIEAHGGGKVFSVEKVAIELNAGGDELSTWASDLGEAFFLSPDQASVTALSKVSQWTSSQNFEGSAKTFFLQSADYYLIAQALAGKHTVVTLEVPSPSLKRIKIPNVCLGLKVKYMTTYQMLRSEHARFVLGSAKKR